MWEYFNDIVCINLDTRRDRYEYAESVFVKLNIPCRIQTVQRHPISGMQGCFQSHITLIDNAYKKGYQNLLVFEDDLAPTESYDDKHIHHAINFLKTHNDWDIFYFGYFVFNNDLHPMHTFMAADPVEPNIIEYNPFATHAYCLSRKGMERILQTCQHYMHTMHYDIYLASVVGLKSYCYIPMLFDQKFCFASDIAPNNALERIARSCQCLADKGKILYRISYFKYWLDMYIGIILAITIIVFLILILARNGVF